AGRLHDLFGVFAGGGADDRAQRVGPGRGLHTLLGGRRRVRPLPGHAADPQGAGVNEVRILYVDTGEDGVRLDRWFKRRWPHLNHIQIQKLVRSGQVRVDGGRTKADARLSAGSQVRVPPLPDAPDPGEKKTISSRDAVFAKSLVLYEDDEVLAL